MKPLKLFLYSSAFFICSCDVDRLPETQISDALYWQTAADLKAASNYLYTFLPTLPIFDDAMSDDAFDRVINEVSTGSRIAPVESEDYNAPYRLIRAANNIIDKTPRAIENGVSEQDVQRYTAEARFFRAWAYFELLKKYGGVPLILEVLTDDSPKLTEGAASREEVIKAIYDDLEFAALNLPTPTQLGTADYGRVSNTAALSLIARAGLFEGTRAKYHSYGNPTDHLTRAREAALAVMESGEHSLFANYFNLFQPAGDGRQNRENILVKQHGISNSNILVRHSTNLFATLDQGRYSPTKALVDAYLMTDGLPIAKSPLYQAPSTSVEVFANRDSRLNATVFKKGDPFIITIPTVAQFNRPDLGMVRTGFYQRKFFNVADYGGTGGSSFTDRNIIRFAEVLLIFAEATFELSGNISDDDLNKSINLLRARAQVAPLTNALVAAYSLDMLEEIRRERRVELAQEGFRYWDLIRWKTAENELPKDILGTYFFADEFGTDVDVNLTSDNYILVQPASVRSFNPQRDYLWPFPITELGLNPNLKQNPNW